MILSLKEGLVKCATVCLKSEVILATTTAAATLGAAEDKRGPVTLSISADNDKKKNGSGGNIGDARENYKFDVST